MAYMGKQIVKTTKLWAKSFLIEENNIIDLNLSFIGGYNGFKN